MRASTASPRPDPADRRRQDAHWLLAPDKARALGVLPLWKSGKVLYVAAVMPLAPGVASAVGTLAELVRFVPVTPHDLKTAQDAAYGPPPWERRLFGVVAARAGKLRRRDIERALRVQKERGGRLGAILVEIGALNYRDIGEILALQRGLPLVDLEDGGEDGRLFRLMPEEFWRRRAVVPLARRGGILTVAMEDPGDDETLDRLREATGSAVRPVVTGRRDVAAALERAYGERHFRASREGLAKERPDDSAHRLLSPGQVAGGAVVTLALIAALTLRAMPTLIVLSGLAQLAYVVVIVFKMVTLREPTERMIETEVTPEEIAALDDASLPVYTVLVPLRREAEMFPVLRRALRELDYPKDRLDVKILLEADDTETIAAAREARLPGYIEFVVVPVGDPRTKPKACNYGLLHARGDYVVIYDAEDIPEPDQLKKALVAFQKLGPKVGCVQAKLSYFNRDQNWLTRWFTAEYAMWFDLMLPALQGERMPIPLGGTSNHFRREVLEGVGAWDPYNVTEDADLGVRLYRAGYRTGMIDSTTYEEATYEFVNWVRQRSRWIKGYVQTWLVHMRHPLRLWREMGARGFLGFQVVVGGTPFTFLLNPVYWLLTTLWFLTSWSVLPQLFPSWIYYVGMLNLAVGNFAFAYLNMVACARRGHWAIVEHTLLAPVYWGLMSLAAWKAAIQLVARPWHWEKTMHGIAGARPNADAARRGESAVAQ